MATDLADAGVVRGQSICREGIGRAPPVRCHAVYTTHAPVEGAGSSPSTRMEVRLPRLLRPILVTQRRPHRQVTTDSHHPSAGRPEARHSDEAKRL
eukprot:7380942-Prymnesium_polylepis.1